MANYGRPPLRDLFDDAPTPHIAHPPRTHHRDFYVATDGSFVAGQGGLGVIVETGDGDRVLRLARVDDSPDNNVAEYRALRLGLDALGGRTGPDVSVGVLVDHDDLAANVNAAALGMAHPDWPTGPVRLPADGADHWRAIRQRIQGFADLRAAAVRSDDNPAHVLANAPEDYRHLDPDAPAADAAAPRSDHLVGRDWEIPPPSRADRHATGD